MRKITFLMALLAVFWGTGTLFSPIYGQTRVYDLQEDFTTDVTNWGFVLNNGSSQTNSYNATNKLLQIRWPNANSSYIKTLTSAITPGTDNTIKVEFVVKGYTSGSSSNYGAIYLLDENGNAISGFHLRRGTIGGTSKWFIGRATTYPGIATYSYPSSADGLNADQPTAKITFDLDFNTHTLSFAAQQGTFDYSTRVFTASGSSVSSSAQSFINISATNIKSLNSWYLKAATASGTNGIDIMYAGISALRSVSTASVTVKFKDQDGSYFKTEEVITEQAVDATYTSTLLQRASIITGGNYYTLNPASPLSVVVANGGSTLELLFQKSTSYLTGIWNGTNDANGNIWSEINHNFLNGSNALGHQQGSSFTFDATAVNKSVSVNDALQLGSGNISITSPNYTFSGSGQLSGSGAFSINLSGSDPLTLGITNNLGGTTQISGGTITISKTGALGTTPNITGATTLISNVSQNFPNISFGASSSIQGGSFSNSISGMSAGAGIKISISSTCNTNSSNYAFGVGTSGTLSSGSELELNGLATSEAKFGMTTASTTYLADTKVSLKGNAFLFIDGSQGAATTINVGLLNGETNAKLGWGKTTALDRDITWSVGATNENSEFAGTITNIGAYRGSGRMYVGDYTNITKEGTGKLTLSGTSTSYNGHLTVNNGELLISGNLQGNNQGAATVIDLVTYNNGPKANTVTVAAGKKLSVTGSLTATNLVINSDANGTGTLVNTGTVSVTNATVKQYLTEGRNWYFTAPVSNATSGVVNATAGNKLFMYDENTAKWIQIVRTDSVLQAGRGYIAQIGTGNTGALTFTGTLNDGNVQTTVSRLGTTKAGFNLVGNPYPSYLNWKACIEDADNVANAKVSTSVWYRTKTAGGAYTFATYNATSNMGTNVETLPATDIVTGNIPPMQAFWVRVNEGQTTGTLTFKNAMRAHKGSQVQGDAVSRNDGKLRAPALQQVLRLQVSNGINSDEAIILFNNSASNSLDMYDSYKMSNNSASIPEIYTSVGSENLVINGLQSYDFNTVLPLGFKAGETNQYVISASQISNFDTDTKIYLRDNATGTQTDLTVGDAYSFTSDATATDSRFSVLFRSAAGTTDLINAHQDVKVYAVDNQIFVENSGSLKSVSAEVFNAVGQKVYNQLLNSDINQLSKEFASGAYVVKINDGAQAVAYKLIVR